MIDDIVHRLKTIAHSDHVYAGKCRTGRARPPLEIRRPYRIFKFTKLVLWTDQRVEISLQGSAVMKLVVKARA